MNILKEPWHPHELQKLHVRFRRFVVASTDGTVDPNEMKKQCHFLRNPQYWRMVRKVAPELIIREDKIVADPNKPISKLHRTLKECGYLEPAVYTNDTLGPVMQCHLERTQDYLFHLFPVTVHRELHEFIDAIYNVKTSFAADMLQGKAADDLVTGLGEKVDGPEAYNEHKAAICDRLFNTMCSFWLAYRKDSGSTTAYRNFCDVYKKFRASEEGWNESGRG